MAAGDIHVFAQFVENTALTGLAALWASDTIKMGIVTNATVPSVTSPDPRWGAGGTTDFSATEVTIPGGSVYTTGGPSLTSPTVTLSSAETRLNATSPLTIAANANNPTGAYWGIFYDSTDAGKHAFGYIDLGGPLSLVSGLTINWAGVGSGTQIVMKATAT